MFKKQIKYSSGHPGHADTSHYLHHLRYNVQRGIVDSFQGIQGEPLTGSSFLLLPSLSPEPLCDGLDDELDEELPLDEDEGDDDVDDVESFLALALDELLTEDLSEAAEDALTGAAVSLGGDFE